MNLVLTDGIPLDFLDGVHIIYRQIAISSVPTLSGHLIAYRWCALPRVRRHTACSRRGNSSNECYLFRFHHGPVFVRLSFPTPSVSYFVPRIYNLCPSFFVMFSFSFFVFCRFLRSSCFYALSLKLCIYSSIPLIIFFSVQQITYRIGNRVLYYWVWFKSDRLI